MDIVFYNNASDPDTINKSLTAVTTLSGSLKNECDIENPSILVENTGMINANYCYIEAFGRFYFVEKQSIISNNIVRVTLFVDELESFKTQLLALPVIIDESVIKNENYMSSDIWKSKVKTMTEILNFPSGLNDSGEYILITAGG